MINQGPHSPLYGLLYLLSERIFTQQACTELGGLLEISQFFMLRTWSHQSLNCHVEL